MRVRDQSGPPILADVGHLHDLEHRLSGPWLQDKLRDGGQSFGGELDYEAELILSDDDTPGSIFKGGTKCSQLLGASAIRGVGT